MDLDLFSDYFATDKRKHTLKIVTFIMFLILALEKFFSSCSMKLVGGEVHIYSTIGIVDILCIAIYLSTALLIALKVSYDRLVIPDFFLLGVKLWIIITEAIHLLTNMSLSTIEQFSAAEHIIEAVLFASFLICMFIGELSHGKKLKNFSSVCMNLLAVCFPLTVVLEMCKLLIANNLHQNPFISTFNFIKEVLGEAFLTIPYFLLILMVCLTENKKQQ